MCASPSPSFPTDHTPVVERAPHPDGLGARSGAAVAFATTEHFNLQTARAVTVSEANGRAGISPIRCAYAISSTED